jgi:hypothetical protein
MQSKLRLKVEELAVESFATAEAGPEARGTVKAHGTYDYCPPPTASEPVACVCMSDEPTYDTTCNPNQCSCMGSFVVCTRRDC